MQDHIPDPQGQKQPTRRLSVGIIAGLSAVVLAAGSASAWWVWNAPTATHKPSTGISTAPITLHPSLAPQPSAAQPPLVAQQPTTHQSQNEPGSVSARTVRVFWLKDTGDRLELTPSSISLDTENQPNEVLKVAFAELLKGPSESAVSSTIPQNTKLLGVEVKQDGVHINLSKEFAAGGGSASMTGRLAQVIYTATSLNPNAKVWISTEGKPLEVLGGEGLLIDQPMTRTAFEQNFSL